MKPPQWLAAGCAAVLTATLVVAAPAGASAAEPQHPADATALTPDERIDVLGSPTSRMAQTDPSLLELTGTEEVPILVKLDHDATAVYTGDVDGYAATSPAVTGQELTGGAAEQRYEAYLADLEAQFASQLAEVAPEASIRQRLRTVYGGVAVTVPADRIDEVLAIDGVAAVQADEARELLTDSSTSFIGADTLYPQLGGAEDAGKGTIVGILDTGGWPEHPSFADLGNLDAPPGPARECNFGPDPTTDDDTPFECNNKLIGGQPFLETYSAELGDEPFPGTARDGNGHGTHTASTAAGNVLESAPVLGADHGPINGVAPGAWIMHYRVCGTDSCFASDSAAAVQQSIVDGVDVLNFSIGGGSEPFFDPVSLAFLDAYAAGILPVASAGNAGPGAGTTNHVAPWITTVAASTQTREFGSTLSLTAGGGATAEFDGVSITSGVPELPVVMSADAPYSDPLCLEPAPEGLFEGVIVACERGEIARVEKGFNVLQGGAEGMVLFNPSLADTASDNHWLPAIHLADGTDFVAFMADHDDVVGTFTDGEKRDGQGNVMAAFSSRGPGGLGLKPDITAPGVQILAGDIPIAGDPAAGGGPEGEFFQAIGGTSMSSPHVAGSALLLTALHPDWTPGQIKSALMTTARQDVVKEDTTTPADPFDYGAGHVDLTVAAAPGLTLDESADNMVALGDDPVNAVHLNLPSVNAPVMPGKVATARTVTNVTDQRQVYLVEVDQPAQGRITVSPRKFAIGAGKSRDLQIKITAAATEEQQFGAIRLRPRSDDLPEQRLPVAFLPQQGGVSLSSSCDPAEINWLRSTTCTVTATNQVFDDVTVDLRTRTDLHTLVTGADGADRRNAFTVELAGAELTAATPSSPTVTPGANPLGGWVPLSALGIAPNPVGHSSLLNFTVPEFVYGHQSYNQIGVTSNGYAVVGGGSFVDVVAEPPGIPDPTRPNNLLAPFWSDLDGTGTPGIRAAVLTVEETPYLVFEWDVNVAGTSDGRLFQLWLGLGGEEDISFAYDPAALPTSPHPFEVGAEDVIGSDGDTLGLNTPPAGDLVVTSSDLVPGSSVSYDVHVRGILPGTGTVTSTLNSGAVPGTTVVTSDVEVKFDLLGWW